MKILGALVVCFSLAGNCLLASQEADKPSRWAGETPRRPIGFGEAGRLAAAASPDLRAARARRSLREGAWMLSLRSYLPQITFTVSEDDRLSLISADSFAKTYTVSAEQLAFDGGRTGAARNIERAELFLMAEEIRRNESELMESALSAYRQILLSRMIIAIRQGSLRSLAEQRRILEEELVLGLALPLDLVQAKITLREGELELETLLMQAEEQERQFTDLLGLDEMPELAERIDTGRSAVVPPEEAVLNAALGGNPDLGRALLSITRKETEAKFASRAWIPTVKATAGFSLSGQRYPLTRYSWTFGFSVNFSSPWFSAASGGSAGREAPHDASARFQQSFSPLPDPAAGFNAKQAGLALVLERENYRRVLDRIRREAAMLTRSLAQTERRRVLAMESLALASEKYRLRELLLGLGRITRIELMEERLGYEQKEAAAAQAAAALLEAERALERFIDLPPGTLGDFVLRRGREKTCNEEF
ncbi:MAG: TolC family protein [Treponema sp.]|nr:TolC family protein [Treponema sp.]